MAPRLDSQPGVSQPVLALRVINGRLEDIVATEKPDLRLIVTCASCGADLQELTAGRIIHGRDKSGTETRAIWRCTECPREYVIEVFLRLVRRNRTDTGCGTHEGYDRHCRFDETPCSACTDAHARQQSPRGHSGIADWMDKTVARRQVTASALAQLVDA